MKKLIACSIVLLLTALCVVVLFPVHGESAIYGSVVRLHILANSDSPEDQQKKLLVRDAVLDFTAPLLEDCRTVEEARQILEEHTEELKQIALNTLQDAGSSDSVDISLGEESYPQRNYDSFCFPSGTYLSLRIFIGEAQGQNWWCCLYPPLCLSSASVPKKQAEDAFVAVGLTPSQYRIITESDEPVYKVRFRILEVLQNHS